MPNTSRVPAAAAIADQDCGDRAGRRAHPHDRSAEHAEGDDPATEPAQRTDEVRRDGDDHGGGLGDPNVRKAWRLARAAERTVEVGPRADREPRRAQSHERGDEQRRQRLADHGESPAHERRDEEREREEPEQVGEETPQRLEPVREAGEESRQRPLERGGRVGDGGQQHAEQGRDEQDDIGGSPRSRLARREPRRP